MLDIESFLTDEESSFLDIGSQISEYLKPNYACKCALVQISHAPTRLQLIVWTFLRLRLIYMEFFHDCAQLIYVDLFNQLV